MCAKENEHQISKVPFFWYLEVRTRWKSVPVCSGTYPVTYAPYTCTSMELCFIAPWYKCLCLIVTCSTPYKQLILIYVRMRFLCDAAYQPISAVICHLLSRSWQELLIAQNLSAVSADMAALMKHAFRCYAVHWEGEEGLEANWQHFHWAHSCSCGLDLATPRWLQYPPCAI